MKNFNIRFKNMKNEQGLTLVEVLASVVLLTLLLTTFITVVIQSAKMNQTSEMIIEATYIAQTEMEKIYAQSKKYMIDDLNIAMLEEDMNYDLVGEFSYKKTLNLNETTYKIEVTFEDNFPEVDHMNQVIVEVLTNEKPQALMENIILWEVE